MRGAALSPSQSTHSSHATSFGLAAPCRTGTRTCFHFTAALLTAPRWIHAPQHRLSIQRPGRVQQDYVTLSIWIRETWDDCFTTHQFKIHFSFGSDPNDQIWCNEASTQSVSVYSKESNEMMLGQVKEMSTGKQQGPPRSCEVST